MFLKKRIWKSMNSYLDENIDLKIEQIRKEIRNADAVMIGAGAGLSTAAGFTYSGTRFKEYFSDFEEKYGFHDMYSGGFYPYETMEEFWAYWSRYIYVNRYQKAPKPVYEKLFDMVKEKDYFVLTTNVDHCFQKAGFGKERLFYTQGDYGLLQCSEPCCQETFDNEQMIMEMVNKQSNMRIPTELIPTCPHCGKLLTTNLRADSTFVQDQGWEEAATRYELFEEKHKKSKMVYLELGVGFNTPGIIKYNFWQRVYQNSNASYICVNLDHAEVPDDIRKQSIWLKSGAEVMFA